MSSSAAMLATQDPESRLRPLDDDALRLWLRLFTCATMIERELGARLKREFRSTLPRFDLLAQLHRAPAGLPMQTLSERLLVTGGNVTWLVTSLTRDALVVRSRAEHDGRSVIVKLTPAGRRHFARMARAHEQWIAELMANVPAQQRRAMYQTLGRLKSRVRGLAANTEPRG